MKSFGARRGRTISVVAMVLGATLVAGCTSSGSVGGSGGSGGSSGGSGSTGNAGALPSGKFSTVQAFDAQQISWGKCTSEPSDDPSADLSAFQCGTVDVPLDYTKPSGKYVSLALVKWPAADPATKVGSLLTNPGGPGASGVDFVEESKQEFDGALHAHYDIIGFDPRGLGRSDPIVCQNDKTQDALSEQDPPKDPTQRAAKAEQDSKNLAAACEKNSGDLLPYVGSNYVAQDMDLMRQVLGDKKLNYLGISYGTYIGSVYAEEFPANVGRMVLDGAVDPNADQLQANVQQQLGFEQSLEKFAGDCVTNYASSCPLSGTPTAAAQQLGHFIDGLQDHPLPTDDPNRPLDQTLGWTGVVIGLYGDVGSDWWKYLREALTKAMKNGDGSELLAGADQYDGRDQSGHYSTEQNGLIAVRCADFTTPTPSAAAVQSAYNQLKTGASILNSNLAPGDLAQPMCANWPFQTQQKPHVIKAQGSDTILVVGTTADPATPYQNAVNLANGFANARLLTRVGTGHAAFGSGNQCAQSAMEAYLVSGTLPPVGERCTA
ncbi:alpha/beta fold hydrolase [Catenulispora sp. NF23]|uniref:Alpha/beta fold hydrolase n=1 Tax=Catenulispora pinistramenti TaxID=2705254 RepID=A0ABS5KZH5_9ACTN|nr:alpha/beta hydrolase [Catenulispora pinistramenti]MBS2534961.1 alpha/beta fold hydrolase [Catenulispora pinistramenti]MBS2551419.1 alpha/beta fold hydrolase [Catenulispora pinistramenti]